MKILQEVNVYVAAKERVRTLFSEFKNIAVCFSGGKDSTTTLELTLEVARELNRLPIPVIFVDQEAEWQSTVDYVDHTMRREEVVPYWFQCPFQISNATSNGDKWLNTWDPEKKHLWVHEQSDIAITSNVFLKPRFTQTFGQALKYVFGDTTKACMLGGVRCEESPGRTAGLTNQATYKHITYGKAEDKKNDQYIFYPLYDWTIKDIWKFIQSNGFKYNIHYDRMYQYGVPVYHMRVSNLHHETALKSIYLLQEFEPKTWDKCTRRLGGIHACGTLGEDEFQSNKLPYMFESWKEYRDYLMPRLIVNEEDRKRFLDVFVKCDQLFGNTKLFDRANKTLVQCILCNDIWFVKWNNLIVRQQTQPIQDAKRQLKSIGSVKRRI